MLSSDIFLKLRVVFEVVRVGGAEDGARPEDSRPFWWVELLFIAWEKELCKYPLDLFADDSL